MGKESVEQGMLDLVAGNVKQVVAPYRQGSVDIYMVSLDAVRVRSGFNEERLVDPKYPEAVREYADSMKANGFFRHKPLLVCPADDGFLYITDGHTRWDAVQLANREGAGIEAVPVVAEERGTTEEDRLFAKHQANSGRQLTPLGEAMLMKRMLGRGISEDEIARRWPCSITKVRNALDLLSVPTPVRDAVQAGEVSATEARKLVKREGAGAVQHLQAAKEAAKAAGKKKVTPKALKAVADDAEPAKSEKSTVPTLPLADSTAAALVHSDDAAVDRFAVEMKSKLAAARAKGRGGWEKCALDDLSRMLREHVEKGDPRDVANFCMFLWHHGASIQPLNAARNASKATS